MSKYREQKVDLNDPNQQAAAAQDTREQPRREPIRAEKTVGRNDPCPCGSGKKYKKLPRTECIKQSYKMIRR